MILYWLVRACSFLLASLPLSAAYALANRAADLTFLFWRKGRANMIDNMAHVLGTEASAQTVRATALKALRNYGKYLVEFLRVPKLTPQELLDRVSFTDFRPFDEALAGGKGAIVVGLHMGNWDLAGGLLTRKGYHLDGIADSFSNRRINGYVQGLRNRLGMQVIPRESAARRVLQALRRNEILAIAMDRPMPREEGVMVTIFGSTAYVPAGAATLSLRTGAPIIPAGVVRLPDNRFLCMVDRCICYEPTDNDEEDIRALTQRIMDALARWVKQNPDQWFMFRRMWPAPEPAPVLSST